MEWFKELRLLLLAIMILVSPAGILAGDLEPPSSPEPTMVSLQEISQKNSELSAKVDELIAYTDDLVCTDAPLPKTNLEDHFLNYDDRYYQKGVSWPEPRFVDNNNGTVTDKLTGLTWLKNANHFEAAQDWATALTLCNNLEDDDSTLTDGSSAGDWRLPNINELESLRAISFVGPCISNTEGNNQCNQGDPFNNVVNGAYWSSTSRILDSEGNYAWCVNMNAGTTYSFYLKTGSRYVWPVRD